MLTFLTVLAYLPLEAPDPQLVHDLMDAYTHWGWTGVFGFGAGIGVVALINVLSKEADPGPGSYFIGGIVGLVVIEVLVGGITLA